MKPGWAVREHPHQLGASEMNAEADGLVKDSLAARDCRDGSRSLDPGSTMSRAAISYLRAERSGNRIESPSELRSLTSCGEGKRPQALSRPIGEATAR